MLVPRHAATIAGLHMCPASPHGRVLPPLVLPTPAPAAAADHCGPSSRIPRRLHDTHRGGHRRVRAGNPVGSRDWAAHLTSSRQAARLLRRCFAEMGLNQCHAQDAAGCPIPAATAADACGAAVSLITSHGQVHGSSHQTKPGCGAGLRPPLPSSSLLVSHARWSGWVDCKGAGRCGWPGSCRRAAATSRHGPLKSRAGVEQIGWFRASAIAQLNRTC